MLDPLCVVEKQNLFVSSCCHSHTAPRGYSIQHITFLFVFILSGVHEAGLIDELDSVLQN